jgi:hypothetical protein
VCVWHGERGMRVQLVLLLVPSPHLLFDAVHKRQQQPDDEDTKDNKLDAKEHDVEVHDV